ncbi:MAG: excinuclease ABC subunit UvrA, partial [Desulfobulbaceae bacterium]|nr:excinuclease ABC subunit UvrA [Desulfobulbaceae bacterium]
MEPQFIRIRGARMHNLKNIDVDLPRNKLVVFTGLSGSGKSSLAFDTLYAEGQRRYVESLSTYARQFLGQMDKPDVDLLEGLSPAVSIEQRTTSRNPRSTVGTITEIYDHLRLLFARAGRPHCPVCGDLIQAQSIQDMVQSLLAYPEGTKVILLAPVVDGKKGEHREALQRLRRDGYVRVRIDGVVCDLGEETALEKGKRHSIEAVVDRLVIKPAVARRLADSVTTAVTLAEGFLLVHFPDTGKDLLFSERAGCVKCGRSLPELSPQLFSFNNPKGACPECGGLGVKQFFDPHLVVPDPTLSIKEGAIAPWGNPWLPPGKRRFKNFDNAVSMQGQMLAGLAAHYGFDLETPFGKLAAKVQTVILQGSGREEIRFEYQRGQRYLSSKTAFEGVLPQLARRYQETSSAAVREDLERYMNEQPCPVCLGARLNPEALAVRLGPWTIAQLTGLSIYQLFETLPAIEFTPQERLIADRVLKEIADRLIFLKDVGLGYLSLGRRASTLSGGEAQRIRLASQIGSRLAGVLYILDEPSIGLHQRDNERLIRTLFRLRDLGNTVLVVEHDSDTIMAADHVLDIGPGAGVHGGEVVYSGNLDGLLVHPQSLTGGYLSGRLEIPVPLKRAQPRRGQWLTVKGATANNLREVTVQFPVGVMTCVTGVSGSGKSSLVIETLYRGAVNHLHQGREQAGECAAILGLERIDKVIDIDQSPIGRT